MRGEYSTKQREAVLDFLKKSNCHLTASDIVSGLKKQGVSIGAATVYRALERLVRDGAAKKITFDSGRCASYHYLDRDECSSHFHLKCVRCGALIHLSCEFLKNMESHILNEHGFTVSSGKTIICGVCTHCSENSSDSE